MEIILHIDMDAFFAAIEERDNPQFRGKPIVVGADPKEGKGRGVVSTANYEARKYGIHSAMPISWAYRANPNAIFLPVDMKRYAKVSRNVMGIAQKYAERREQVSIDEAYLEINPKFEYRNPKQTPNFQITNYKHAEEIAEKVKKEIWEKERLTCSIGIGPNKLVAKIASDYRKPDGLTVVRPAEVQSFLDPMPANVIPGIGPKTYNKLAVSAVETVADLRKISKERLIEMFGVAGEHMWQMAHGEDRRPVVEEREIKSVGRQTTFQQDVQDSGPVVEAAIELLKETFEELRDYGLKGRTLTVTVRYTDFETHTSQESKKQPLAFEEAKKMALKLLLPYFNGRGVRLVGVRVSNWVE